MTEVLVRIEQIGNNKKNENPKLSIKLDNLKTDISTEWEMKIAKTLEEYLFKICKECMHTVDYEQNDFIKEEK